jgi:hypothetical protein
MHIVMGAIFRHLVPLMPAMLPMLGIQAGYWQKQKKEYVKRYMKYPHNYFVEKLYINCISLGFGRPTFT